MIHGLKEETEIIYNVGLERIICDYRTNNSKKPCLIFICGIHGNEPMGVRAMEEVSKEIDEENIEIRGSFVGVRGNVKALKQGERYLDSDLNRVWLGEGVKEMLKSEKLEHEEEEMREIWEILRKGFHQRSQKEVVVFDLHTTSSPSVPFITINDTISNRNIAKKYPVATVFGIEEFLDGPLLSYINELGYNAIGFEGGQHDDEEALKNHKAFIWISLANQGHIKRSLKKVKAAKSRLKNVSDDPYKFFEITHRHDVKETDHFEMNPGYTNFQNILKESKLAISNNEEIISEWNDRIFMPLYQSKGEDGFFIVRRISPFFLWLSKVLRTYHFEKLLVLFPGVALFDDKKHILAVNNNIASYMRNDVFHLFGFRQKILHNQSVTLFIRREKQ